MSANNANTASDQPPVDVPFDATPVTTKNAGELSETYAVVYILGHGVLPVVNGRLAAIAGEEIRFLKIERLNPDGQTLTYEIEYGMYGGKVRARGTPELDSRSTIDCKEFREAAEGLLRLIESKASKKIPIDEPAVERALSLLGSPRVSAKATDKSDFSATVMSNGVHHTHGFSVKSQVAGSSTLLNASRESSYFEFEILRNGRPALESEIAPLLEGASAGFDALLRLRANGFDLVFRCTSPTLDYTLRVIDTCGPELIASLLLEELARRERAERAAPTLAELVARFAARVAASPQGKLFARLGENADEIRTSLEFKTKNFLLAFSAGATPGKRWDGLDTTEGGIIVVKKDGEVVCLQLSTRNAVGEYLINSCRFESPSSSRHHWGTPYYRDGRAFVRMQLQVRFTA